MILSLIFAGIVALREYIAEHVITCLVPAFLLAGAMVSFISKETIIKYLGYTAKRIRSFALAGGGSFLLAACSCTVIPVASGLYYRGSGIGPAFILLWVAPAANILALLYTGAILGYDMVGSRIISAILMAFIVGTIMTLVFRKSEEKKVEEKSEDWKGKIIGRSDLILILLILVTLLSPNYVIRKGPYVHKVIVWAVSTIVMVIYVLKVKTNEELKNWMSETFFFVRIIFPLLLLGVFIVGIIGKILPQEWINNYLGGSSVGASFLATMIGAISYFATMTEAPFVDTLVKLGMGKGPALALLLTGPGISLPNWLAIARVFGAKKAICYVLTIIVLGTVVGWFFGNFIF